MVQQIANVQPQQPACGAGGTDASSKTQGTDMFRTLLKQVSGQNRTQGADTGKTDGSPPSDEGLQDSGKTAKGAQPQHQPAENLAALCLAQTAALQDAVQSGMPALPTAGQAADGTSAPPVQPLPQAAAVPLSDSQTAPVQDVRTQAVLPDSATGSAKQVQQPVQAVQQSNAPVSRAQALEPKPAAEVLPQQAIPADNQKTAASVTLSESQAPVQNSTVQAAHTGTSAEPARQPAQAESGVTQQTAPKDAGSKPQVEPSAPQMQAVSSATAERDAGAQTSADSGGTQAQAENQLPARQQKAAEKAPNVSTVLPESGLYEGGKVVVKVSDAAVQTRAPSPGRQVAGAVVRQLRSGKQEFEMELSPQSLGKVSVKLVSENGMLTIEIAAANPRTQSLMLSNSGDIRSILHAATGQAVTVTGTQQQPSWQEQSRHGGSGGYSGGQEPEQQQHRRKDRPWNNDLGSDYSTGDFLSLMKLRAVGA